MTEALSADELARRWAKTLGAAVDWAQVDPDVTQRPEDAGGTLSGLATLGQTLSGGMTMGGTLSGGRTVGGGAAGAGASTAVGATGISGAAAAHFDIVGELGRGGMGVVYRARQRSLARDIALKFIRPEQANAGARERFVSEALVNGLLDHPNIVPVHELGTNAGGEVYLAMKLVGGRSWKALLHPHDAEERAAAATYDIDRHLGVLGGVCNAIAFAHSRGIVHRDLKPENVMVGEFGEVLVMDWGIAVDVRDAPDGDQRAQHKSTVTAPSGTPSYMAPELAEGRGKDIGPWTDVYLLGAILHEVLTGAPPHRGRTLMEVLLAASRSSAPAYGPAVPAGLGAIAARAMSRDRHARQQSVGEFQAALGQYVKHRESDKIATAARELLAEADAMGDGAPAAATAGKTSGGKRRYGAYAEAVAGFKQALVLWADNTAARDGERAARIAYAKAALAGGDVGLAEAELEPLAAGTEADALRAQAAQARTLAQARERAAKRNRLMLVGSALLIIVGLTVGVLMVNAERQRTQTERDHAKDQEKLAEAARDQAITAERATQEQRDKAIAAEATANEQRALAVQAKVAAQQRLVSALRQRGNDEPSDRSLVWDAEALRAAAGIPELELLQRRRLGTRLARLPIVTGLTCLDGAMAMTYGGRWLSADGRVALLRSEKEEWPACTVQLWDLETLKPLSVEVDAPYGDGMATWSLSDDGATLWRKDASRTSRVTLADGSLVDAPMPKAPQPGDAAEIMKTDGGPLIGKPDGSKLPLVGLGTLTNTWLSPAHDRVVGTAESEHAGLWNASSGELIADIDAKKALTSVEWADSVAMLYDGEKIHVIDQANGRDLAELWPMAPAGHSYDRCRAIEERGECRYIVLEYSAERRYAIDVYEIRRKADGGREPIERLHGIHLPGKLYDIRQRARVGADGEQLRLLCQPETFGPGGYGEYQLVVADWKLPAADDSLIVPDTEAVAVSADGAVVVVAAAGRLHRLGGKDRKPLGAPLPLPRAGHAMLALSDDGTRYAVFQDKSFSVHATADGAMVGAAWTSPHEGPLFRLSHDGRRLLDHDGQTVEWREPDTGRSGTITEVFSMVTPDMLLLQDQHLVHPWIAGDQPVLLAIPPHHGFFLTALSPDGRLGLSVTGMKNTPCYAQLWDLATGQPKMPPIPYQMYPIDGGFSPDGTRFAVSVLDGNESRIFDTATCKPMSLGMKLEGYDTPRFTADGTLLASINNQRATVSWWDVRTGEFLANSKPTGDPDDHDVTFNFAADAPWILPDGSTLTASGRMAKLIVASGSTDELVEQAHLASGSTIDSAGAMVDLLPHDYATAFTAMTAAREHRVPQPQGTEHAPAK